jgi:hypothetical protein
MIGKIRSEMILRRRILPISGLRIGSKVLTLSGAKVQTAGVGRRQERRTGSQQHLQARRRNRQERRTEQHSAPRRPKVALALQGGGTHGAYTLTAS